MTRQVLLGDDAVGLAALHAGISGVYGYPGTPSTEIFEFIQARRPKDGSVSANWAANEKVGMEEAVGVSFAGRRSLVTMKHVGLNVAADPFMNSAITGAGGGLVYAVADDPSMHSSQNEQDSRYFADFALVPCMEPGSQQEAYDMTREAFELSERLEIPVMLRLVTRLAHSRADVEVGEAQAQTPLNPTNDTTRWTLLPVNARAGYQKLLDKQAAFLDYAENARWNELHLTDSKVGVIAAGLGYNYFREVVGDSAPSYLKLGVYPVPVGKLTKLVEHCDEIIVLEDGYPFVERQLRGLLGVPGKKIHGRLDGTVPRAGELNPTVVKRALEGAGHETKASIPLPKRPPALCKGCPHGDTYTALKEALKEAGATDGAVFADIGCYTLGAYPPYEAIDSTLDMGASISMAAGASDAGLRPAVAVIGDSTFVHSGMTPLVGAAKRNAPVTVIILDNATVGMTGQQETMATGQRLVDLVLGLGVAPGHLRKMNPLPKNHDEMVEILKEEITYEGTSVVIAKRPCIQIRRK